MKNKQAQVLLLDDERDIRTEINEFLNNRDISVKEASSPSQAFSILSSIPIDVAILDIRLPEMSGLEVLDEIRREHPDVPNIMISGHGDMDSVIEALRMGAVDYFKKPFDLNKLHKAIRKHINAEWHNPGACMAATECLTIQGNNGNDSINMIACSPLMKKTLEKMQRVSRSSGTTVLITGESGTGKELVAKGIHQLSERKEKPFIAVNCSSVPDELFESEFFGFKKGAFTSAYSDKPGWFEAADQGTLFLDEIADLKPNLQAKLLRIMEDRHIARLGSTRNIRVDVRIVAATNRDLKSMVARGKFREDLYHRLNIFTIQLPPLRERCECIPQLFNQFVEHYSKKLLMKPPRIEKEIHEALTRYDFPGNVRELMHMVERGLIMCEGDRLKLHHFEQLRRGINRMHSMAGASRMAMPLDALEKESIESCLRENNFNKSKTARLLNISRQALDRRIAKYGIEMPG